MAQASDVPTDFDLNCDEFSDELDALSQFVVPKDETPRLSPKARIAASNAATLLLAATFEEYIRQQVRSTFRARTKSSKHIHNLPKKLPSKVWRSSLERLARTQFLEIEADVVSVGERLDAIAAFCLRKEASDVTDAIAHNESNMRADQIRELFNRVGVEKVLEKCCSDRELRDHLGQVQVHKACAELETKFTSFFTRRNRIAHAIRSSSSSGSPQLMQDIDTFRVFAVSLSRALNRELQIT